MASWYGDAFHMKATANGEIFDMNAVSAAHTTLPLPSIAEVTNLDNGRSLTVRVNDRGPFVGNRIIDLSHEAARELGYDRKGLAHVRVRYLGPAPLLGPEAGIRMAQARPKASSPPAARAYAMQMLPPPAPAAAAPMSAPALAETAAGVFRVQAGAFSDPANAKRAVSLLTEAGTAFVEPFQRNGTTLYRVILPASGDEGTALALRARIAGIGFADAQVVKPF
jgi:rare lipoprotein A